MKLLRNYILDRLKKAIEQEMSWISKCDVYWNLIRRSLNNLEKSIRTTSH